MDHPASLATVARLPGAPSGRVRGAGILAFGLLALCPTGLTGCTTTPAVKANGSAGESPSGARTAAGLVEPVGTPIGTTAPRSDAPGRQTVAVRVTDPALADEFNNIFATGDVYLAGWPTEEGLKQLAARGVKRVIALKTPEEVLHARAYDPRVVAKRLGMELIVLPVRPDTYGPADVEAFAKALNASDGPVLVHCGSASTSAMVWSGYLAKQPGVTAKEVMDAARAAGLLEGPMTESAERVAKEIIKTQPATKPQAASTTKPQAANTTPSKPAPAEK